MEDKFEIVCDECSKTFESTDEDATLCSECWRKIVLGEGVGED